MDNEDKIIYKAALTTYGNQAQIIMLLEEMSELQKEICKTFRGKTTSEKIIDEIADVEIMLEQMKILFNVWSKVFLRKKYKINRLKKKLGL